MNNIWKSYMRTAGWRIIIWKEIIAVLDTTFAVVERKPEKIQACTGFEPLTSAIPVQRSTNWANKPTGSRSLNWFVINPWKDDDEVMNIWKSYMRTVGWRIIWKKISTVIDATFAVAKRKPGKIQALTDFHIFIQFCLLLCFKGNIWAKFITGFIQKITTIFQGPTTYNFTDCTKMHIPSLF